MKDNFFSFYCICRCRSLWKLLHICTLELSEFLSKEGVVEGKGEGRAGCCTCLLPWGFWCSDYAVMRRWEWRICFCEGGSNGKNVCMSWSLTHQLCGGGIYFKKRVSKALKQGAASETFDFDDYLTVQIKLRTSHHTNG